VSKLPPTTVYDSAQAAAASGGLRYLLYGLFAVSGFSGLIYESIWTHYLKLFLGHAAYAQSLVLAIFMLGMAGGSWLASRYSVSYKNLLLAYAVVEGVVGVLGLVFHRVFVQLTEIAYHSLLPSVNAIALAHALKWSIAVLLIAPQSILLGMTFPLMSAGLIRWFPQRPGASLAMLYFSNSCGAAVGVLVSGFVLIQAVGLPGTVLTAGIINVLLALAVWMLVKGRVAEQASTPAPTTPSAAASGSYYLLMMVALFTGTASFIYEIGWLRMLALVLGSSTHAFELMLSAFIFGLALGGLWIRRRIDEIGSSTAFLAFVQVCMGVLAMATLLVYGHSFEFMQWTLRVLTKTDSAYTVFNLASNLLALAVMLPATFCAGMTLPLITYALLQQGHGERSIGMVYAVNTLGAIVGVAFAVHIGMPVLGLKGLIVTGATIDVALGLVLLWRWRQPRLAGAITVVGLGAVAMTVLWVHLDAYKMASGVYRNGVLLSPSATHIRYHKDGKTTTVDLVQHRGNELALRVNGKTDALIGMTPGGPVIGDEPTMVMLGAIPLLLHPQAKTAAAIGLGAGLTTQILLSAPWLQRVDTIEIEPAVVVAARGFRPRVDATFTDPRSHIIVDDAKTYFATHRSKYDIIVSEPSNPWVSGVASLFSQEFYARVRTYLNHDGLFVQWVQLYEINPRLVASILKALSRQFADYAVYTPMDWDLVIVASPHGRVPDADGRAFEAPALARALARIGIANLRDFELHRVGTREVLDPLFASFAVPANSDYFPVLDLGAAKTRFLGADAGTLAALADAPLPALDMLAGTPAPMAALGVSAKNGGRTAVAARKAIALRDFFVSPRAEKDYGRVPASLRADATLVMLLLQDCRYAAAWKEWFDSLFRLSVAMSPYLSPAELQPFWRALDLPRCQGGLTVMQQHWLALLQAVSGRDAPAMERSAAAVLAEAGTFEPDQFDYALAAGMLGSLLAGDPERAQEIWRAAGKLPGEREPAMLFRLLVAHISASESRTLARRD
jgi:spermidine synthase